MKLASVNDVKQPIKGCFYREQLIWSLILDMLSLTSLLDVQMEMSNSHLDVHSYSAEHNLYAFSILMLNNLSVAQVVELSDSEINILLL